MKIGGYDVACTDDIRQGGPGPPGVALIRNPYYNYHIKTRGGRAADEFRSTNGQLQWIIMEALRRSGRLKKSRVGKPEPKPEKE